jgi:hypothetical protein
MPASNRFEGFPILRRRSEVVPALIFTAAQFPNYRAQGFRRIGKTPGRLQEALASECVITQIITWGNHFVAGLGIPIRQSQ